MLTKTLIITGAGFSYPAHLPIQSRIIDEMLSKPPIGFMGDWDLETFSFYKAYIHVAIFLLENYTLVDSNKFKVRINQIIDNNKKMKIEHKFIKNISSTKKFAKEIEKTTHLKTLFNDKSNLEEAVLNNELIKDMANLKEDVRQALVDAKITVDLEDLFTKLDKCAKTQSYWKKYSFIKVVEIRQYILQLFIYYFGKKNIAFTIDKSYESFAEFVKNNHPSVITTNWDTICEQIFESVGIKYDNCLNCDSYYKKYTSRIKPQIAKIHGSINWFTCSNCNSLIIKPKGKETELLLSDKKVYCAKCKAKQKKNDILFVPEIITPTMVKQFTKHMYINIWQNAQYLLENANQIIFVGYSMPLADFEFRFMLTKYISPHAKISVVLHESDKKEPGEKHEVPEDRYRCAFPKNDIDFYYNGFTDFFDSKL